MPVVFVHGVAVRDTTDSYAATVKTRDALLRRLALRQIVPGFVASQAEIFNPYWGGEAAKFAWRMASLPDEGIESFGPSAGLGQVVSQAVIGLLAAGGQLGADDFLPKLARQKSLSAAIDLLFASAVVGEPSETAQKADALGSLAAVAAEYVVRNPDLTWLTEVSTNTNFATRLLSELKAFEASRSSSERAEEFGVGELWKLVTETARKIGTAATAAITNPIVRAVRPTLNTMVATFVGDVFCYLRSREKDGNKSPIVDVVSKQFMDATSKRRKEDPLIIVGHSMGGNISYDLLTSFLTNEVTCDVFLTIGSQVGLFEELKLFESSDPNIVRPHKVSRPKNILRWINVFDHADVLSYRTSTVFEGVEDFEYDTGETVVKAHGAYLLQPTFHQRLNARLREP